jgi:protein SCO1/2
MRGRAAARQGIPFMSRRLLVILAILAVAFAALTAVAVQRGILAPRNPAQQTATVGGPFQLIDQNGRAVDQHVLDGKWSAVFFGFTYCPDVCPTTMFALGQAERQLGPAAKKFQTVFVSVDPARDTPKQLASYLSTDAFPKAALGLTGSPQQVEAAAKAYKVFYQKVGEGAGYTVNHSSIIYLMNPRGGLACVIPYDAPPAEMAAKVKAAMAQGPGAQSC